jgi:hypothetical protein
MTPRNLIQVLTLSLVFHSIPTRYAAAQHVGLAGSIGIDRWYSGPSSFRGGIGGFHSLQVHQSIAFRTTVLLSYSEPWQSAAYLEKQPTAGLILQLAPTLIPRPGVFVRAGVEAVKRFGPQAVAEGQQSTPTDLRINGLVSAGIQRNKWEVGIQLGFRQPDTKVHAPLYGTHLAVARLLHSGSRRFAADRRWKKPLLPWQQSQWGDRSREWRSF